MPCSAKGHQPIHGMGRCGSKHVNRFCDACYGPASLGPAPCKTCNQPLTEFSAEEKKNRAWALAEYQAQLDKANQPQVQLSIQLPPPELLESRSSNPTPELATTAAEDLKGERWKEIAAALAARKKSRVVFDYPATDILKFRKAWGLREPREAGFSKGTIAVRTVWRVSRDDQRATDFARPKKAMATTSIASLGEKGNTVSPAPSVGYLAMVPMPMAPDDNPLGDRHPLVLAEMYANALGDRETAWKRLRVLLAVNLRDDYRYLDDTTRELAALVKTYVDLLNQAFVDLDLPARAIAVLWGPTCVKQPGKELADRAGVKPINLDLAGAPGPSVDLVRAALDKVKKAARISNKPKATEFPFATVRSFLVRSTEAERMIAELAEYNDHVFLHTGDGDLVTLDPEPTVEPTPEQREHMLKRHSLFDLYDLRLGMMTGEELAKLARVGGATAFDGGEVYQQIASIKRKISEEETLTVTDGDGLALTKSTLLTMLAKSLDTCVRGILGMDLPGTGYFAEPNTLLNAALISDLKLGEINNEMNKEMPDWASEINRRITARGGYTQLVLPEVCYQLNTSSRSALVVVSDDARIVGDEEIVRIGHGFTLVNVLSAFTGEHNTQIKDTQVNERFKEVGMGWAQPVKQALPLREDYEAIAPNLPLTMLPGAVLLAVWAKKDVEEVSQTWATLGRDDDLEPYFRANYPKVLTRKTLAAFIEEFPNQVDMLSSWEVYERTRELLTTLQEHQAAQRGEHGQSAEMAMEDEGEGEDAWVPVHDALIKIDVVFRWGLGMIRRIMSLR